MFFELSNSVKALKEQSTDPNWDKSLTVVIFYWHCLVPTYHSCAEQRLYNYWASVHPSVCPSHSATICRFCGFAAVGLAVRRYWSIAAAAGRCSSMGTACSGQVWVVPCCQLMWEAECRPVCSRFLFILSCSRTAWRHNARWTARDCIYFIALLSVPVNGSVAARV